MKPSTSRFRIRPSSLTRLPRAAPGMRIGLYGGSFNPAHAGHRHVSQMALKRLGLDRRRGLGGPDGLGRKDGFGSRLLDVGRRFDLDRRLGGRLGRLGRLGQLGRLDRLRPEPRPGLAVIDVPHSRVAENDAGPVTTATWAFPSATSGSGRSVERASSSVALLMSGTFTLPVWNTSPFTVIVA